MKVLEYFGSPRNSSQGPKQLILSSECGHCLHPILWGRFLCHTKRHEIKHVWRLCQLFKSEHAHKSGQTPSNKALKTIPFSDIVMCLQGYYETTSISSLWRVSRNSGAYWPLFSGLLPHWNAKWNYNQRRRQYATVKEWLILLPLLPWLYILTSISACQKSCQNVSWAAWNVSSSSSCRPWQQAYSWTLSVARSKLCRLCLSCVDFGILKQGTLQSREAFAKIFNSKQGCINTK